LCRKAIVMMLVDPCSEDEYVFAQSAMKNVQDEGDVAAGGASAGPDTGENEGKGIKEISEPYMSSSTPETSYGSTDSGTNGSNQSLRTLYAKHIRPRKVIYSSSSGKADEEDNDDEVRAGSGEVGVESEGGKGEEEENAAGEREEGEINEEEDVQSVGVEVSYDGGQEREQGDTLGNLQRFSKGSRKRRHVVC
jgi:hypothetical protein